MIDIFTKNKYIYENKCYYNVDNILGFIGVANFPKKYSYYLKDKNYRIKKNNIHYFTLEGFLLYFKNNNSDKYMELYNYIIAGSFNSIESEKKIEERIKEYTIIYSDVEEIPNKHKKTKTIYDNNQMEIVDNVFKFMIKPVLDVIVEQFNKNDEKMNKIIDMLGESIKHNNKVDNIKDDTEKIIKYLPTNHFSIKNLCKIHNIKIESNDYLSYGRLLTNFCKYNNIYIINQQLEGDNYPNNYYYDGDGVVGKEFLRINENFNKEKNKSKGKGLIFTEN